MTDLPRLFGPDMHEDPYPVYQKLRETDPVHWDDALQAWVLTLLPDAADPPGAVTPPPVVSAP